MKVRTLRAVRWFWVGWSCALFAGFIYMNVTHITFTKRYSPVDYTTTPAHRRLSYELYVIKMCIETTSSVPTWRSCVKRRMRTYDALEKLETV